MRAIIKLINDIKIIFKVTKEEECHIKECEIKFEPAMDSPFINNNLDDNKSDIINIELEDEFSINLCEMTIDKINFNYNHIDNKRPYTFDFHTLINDKILCHCIIDDVYIDHRYSVLNEKTSELHLRTRVGSKLILEKISSK